MPKNTEIAGTGLTGPELPEIALRIMEAAIDLFGRKGYTATSVREIVQQARVTNPMLYYYFGSKEGLFHETLEYLLKSRLHAIETIVESNSDFDGRLNAVIDLHFGGIVDSPRTVAFVYAVLFGPRETRPEFDIQKNNQQVLNLVAQVFSDAIKEGRVVLADPEWTPQFLALSFMGQVSLHMMHALKELQWATSCSESQQLQHELTNEVARERLLRFFKSGAFRDVESQATEGGSDESN